MQRDNRKEVPSKRQQPGRKLYGDYASCQWCLHRSRCGISLFLHPYIYLLGANAIFIGNVSFELPALHPGFLLEVDSPDVGPHHPDFAKTAATRSSFERALRFAKAMAATGLNILQDKEMRDKMWDEHREKFKNPRATSKSHL